MELKDFVRARARMCHSFSKCTECDVNKRKMYKAVNCHDFQIQYPDEYIECVEKWAQEHPIKTNRDKFYEMFKPEGEKWYAGCTIEDPSCHANHTMPCNGCKWWGEEYKGE